jgi:hypothetical protein
MSWQTQLMHKVPTICRDVVEALPNLRRESKLSEVMQFKDAIATAFSSTIFVQNSGDKKKYDPKLLAPYMDPFALMNEATWRNVLLYTYQTGRC